MGSFLGPIKVKTLKVGPSAAMSNAMAKFLQNIVFLVSNKNVPRNPKKQN